MGLERKWVEADSSELWGFGFCSRCIWKAGDYPGMDHVPCFKNDVHMLVYTCTQAYAQTHFEVRVKDPLGLQ